MLTWSTATTAHVQPDTPEMTVKPVSNSNPWKYNLENMPILRMKLFSIVAVNGSLILLVGK